MLPFHFEPKPSQEIEMRDEKQDVVKAPNALGGDDGGEEDDNGRN